MSALPLPPLLDHHCHGVLRTDPTAERFASFLTESDAPPAPGTTFFDTQAGFAVRRWCPPLLGLEPHCPPDAYLARRRELGAAETTRRLLAGSGIGGLLVDTGIPGDLLGPAELAAAAGPGTTAREILRLERLAEHTADRTDDTRAFLDGLAGAVEDGAGTAAGFKSVLAYRHGLDIDPAPPGPAEVRAAAGRWLAGRSPGGRLTDPVLLRHLLWSAVRTGRPLQLHTGFGDPDLTLHHCDPLLLTGFVRATAPTGCPLVLLHCYPYHRQAGYLAHAFPHVHLDMGLALTHTGARATAVLGEMLELAPFGKLLFSTDAYGLPELYVVGAELFRRGLRHVLGAWVAEGVWAAADAQRVAAMIAADNARRVYGPESFG
ncbi:amidohydrolase [Streptomyces mashuensis]|uniref:Amidohydrolase n=1 Tax=Streptomyces mashuensis TaxID=33904 RepID=A0A919AY36_9ACTN|nr:amidohydrolase family protein [Streptomyces mashuensis]GHF30702.1 amidohydrolase [Streptomyces mashuensis]